MLLMFLHNCLNITVSDSMWYKKKTLLVSDINILVWVGAGDIIAI
jgi:hypothetical protein